MPWNFGGVREDKPWDVRLRRRFADSSMVNSEHTAHDAGLKSDGTFIGVGFVNTM